MNALDTAPGPIALDVHVCAARRTYRATFTTEAQAIDFITERSSTHAFWTVDSTPIPDGCTALLDTLYPTCEHGLSDALCAGPGHYPADR